MRTPNVYGVLSAQWAMHSDLALLVSGDYTGAMEVPRDSDEQSSNTTSPMTTIDEDVRWTVRGTALASELVFNAGVRNLTNEFQQGLDTGPERDAGYVCGPSTPRMITAGIEMRF